MHLVGDDILLLGRAGLLWLDMLVLVSLLGMLQILDDARQAVAGLIHAARLRGLLLEAMRTNPRNAKFRGSGDVNVSEAEAPLIGGFSFRVWH